MLALIAAICITVFIDARKKRSPPIGIVDMSGVVISTTSDSSCGDSGGDSGGGGGGGGGDGVLALVELEVDALETRCAMAEQQATAAVQARVHAEMEAAAAELRMQELNSRMQSLEPRRA